MSDLSFWELELLFDDGLEQVASPNVAEMSGQITLWLK